MSMESWDLDKNIGKIVTSILPFWIIPPPPGSWLRRSWIKFLAKLNWGGGEMTTTLKSSPQMLKIYAHHLKIGFSGSDHSQCSVKNGPSKLKGTPAPRSVRPLQGHLPLHLGGGGITPFEGTWGWQIQKEVGGKFACLGREKVIKGWCSLGGA